MIKRQTVFVLGAGASRPYAFPTGGELRDIVLRSIRWPGPWTTYLSELGFDQSEVEGFARHFRESPRPSVDLFVEHRPEYLRLGEAVIALALIPCEQPNRVFPTPKEATEAFSEDNWYQYIFDKMNAPFDQFGDNNVSFVTFNYDRSLEHFFRTGLKHSYTGKSLADADAVLEKIPIVHVHGRLGALDGDGRYFEPNLSTRDVRIAMDDIVIMPYAEHDSPAFQKARELLESAEHIFFLGFGYYESNMSRLQVAAYDGKISGGTSVGLGEAELRDIEAEWHVPLHSIGNLQNMNSLAFLKNVVSFR